MAPEDDDWETFSDSRSVDMLAQTSVHWLRNVVRRNTQVAPEGILKTEFSNMNLHQTRQRILAY
jgi:hypothetical protein